MKNFIEFDLGNGQSAFMQIEEDEEQAQARRVNANRNSEDESQTLKAKHTFNDAIGCITPIGKALLNELQNINTPDEVKLEFDISFNGKAGVIFTSASTEASFKVSITWKNK